MKINQKKKGFTLIELIVVIAILGILAAIMVPRFTGFRATAGHGAALAEAKTISSAMEAINANTGSFPANQAAVETFLGKTLTGTLTPAADGSFSYVVTFSGTAFTATGTAGGVITVAP